MELEGKAKEAFEKWYLSILNLNNDEYQYLYCGLNLDQFYNLRLNMQWGVYVDFFSYKGIEVDVFSAKIYEDKYYASIDVGIKEEFEAQYSTRHQAREEAIKKATQILNEILN